MVISFKDRERLSLLKHHEFYYIKFPEVIISYGYFEVRHDIPILFSSLATKISVTRNSDKLIAARNAYIIYIYNPQKYASILVL